MTFAAMSLRRPMPLVGDWAITVAVMAAARANAAESFIASRILLHSRHAKNHHPPRFVCARLAACLRPAEGTADARHLFHRHRRRTGDALRDTGGRDAAI